MDIHKEKIKLTIKNEIVSRGFTLVDIILFGSRVTGKYNKDND
mgnify:CR=1 FL=1